MSGEYDLLLYHRKIELNGKELHKRDGYSHDFLGHGHLTIVGNKIKRLSNENSFNHTMRNTHTLADLKFGSK
jgi:hypothetical protein